MSRLIKEIDVLLADQKAIIELGYEPLGEQQSKIYGAIESVPTANIDKDVRAEAYNKGLNDAWELAKKVALEKSDCTDGYTSTELKTIFNSMSLQGVFRKYSAQEALAKLEAYEKEQAEIKVGDVVERMYDGAEFLIITEEHDSSAYNFGVIVLQDMTIDRITGSRKRFKKTGKHIDIQSMLQQIGGGSDD